MGEERDKFLRQLDDIQRSIALRNTDMIRYYKVKISAYEMQISACEWNRQSGPS